MEPIIRPATQAEYLAVIELLEEADLPTAGLDQHSGNLFVLASEQEILGCIAFENYHPDALLRSLVVPPPVRGRGYGRQLLAFAAAELSRRGYRAAYGLTTTIPELLSTLGFTAISRAQLPPALSASAELRGACPQTALVFMIELAPSS